MIRILATKAVVPVLGLLAVLSIPAVAQPIPTFTDIALEAGFQDRLGHGRALVAADFNNDGWVDFYVGNPGDPVVAPDDSLILWNDGPGPQGEITFTRGQVLLNGENAFTASAADYDGDGDFDLFIGIGGQEGIGLDYLFRNDDGFFTDVSADAGVRGPIDSDGQPFPTGTSSGTWADYDNDGDLDLFVSARQNKLSLPHPLSFRSSLFRNNGDGTFTDVSVESGAGSPSSDMTAAWGDFNDDGWMDLYIPIISPVRSFRFLRNMADGTFEQMPITAEDVNYSKRASWASSVSDFNLDGLLDVISWGRRDAGKPSNQSHALLINQGDESFVNEAVSSGLVIEGALVPATMGTAIGDFNNDGYPEMYIGNGGPTFGESDNLFLNTTPVTGHLSFQEVSEIIDYEAAPDPDCVPPDHWPPAGVSPKWVDNANMLEGTRGDGVSIDSLDIPAGDVDPCLPTYPYHGHGSLFLDIDKDGDLDLALAKGGSALIQPDLWSGEPNRLFRNDGPNMGNWLFITLDGLLSNRDAYGAAIEVDSSLGGGGSRTLIRQVQGETGFSSSGPREVHFGLGAHDQIDEIRVRWPSGAVSVLTDLAVNQRLEVSEPFLQTYDFNDGELAPWQPLRGDWGIARDALVQSQSQFGFAWLPDLELTDFTVVGKLVAQTGQGRLALLGRIGDDGKSFYAAVLSGSMAQIFIGQNGQLTPLGVPIEIVPMSPNRAYVVRLTFAGSRIEMEINRQAAPAVIDPTLTSGRIGLATVGAAAFDSIGVY